MIMQSQLCLGPQRQRLYNKLEKVASGEGLSRVPKTISIAPQWGIQSYQREGEKVVAKKGR